MRRRTFLTLAGGGLVAPLAAWMTARAVRSRSSKSPPDRPPLEIRSARTVPAHTSSAQTAVYSPPVRVNLTPASVKSVSIAITRRWKIVPSGGERVLARGDSMPETAVTATATGFQIGPHRIPSTRIEIQPDESPSIWVDDHEYRGTVRLFRRSDHRLIAVNVLPLEEYVASVVNGEMPASFPDEARKTQAILARSYGVFRVAESRGHPEFDLYATTRSQKYLGTQYRTADGRRLAGESESSRKLTSETAGIVCTSNGRVFSTYYCAVCGGKTIDGSGVFSDAADCIRGVECDWCQAASLYRWTARVSPKQATESLKGYFQERGQALSIVRAITRIGSDETGPATQFVIDDGSPRKSISAADLRRTLPASTLHSPFFSVKREGEEFVFSGRGHGHGVGVCQWGARGLALEQKDCFGILRHYYPGVKFVRIEEPGA